MTGLLATVPGYAGIDLSEVTSLIGEAYPEKAPESVQLLLLLTEEDEAYVVLGLDTQIDRFITAGTVTGKSLPRLELLPPELDFAQRIIVAESIALSEPLAVTPDQVNADPDQYALKRISMETTYIFTGTRLKDAPEGLGKIGFGLATDELGSTSLDRYLTVIDPYNTETQIRTAEVTGTVLLPTEGMRRLLSRLLRFGADDIEEALQRPSVFYEDLADDEAQLLTIDALMPTVSDPTVKLAQYDGEMISVQGLALGKMVRTEDIEGLKKLPIALTAKIIGVADLTGAMPIVGISSENISGEVFGFFRFDLAVEAFTDGKAYAFLINREVVPLDPVAEVERAGFGDRVSVTLSDYAVTEIPAMEIVDDLVLAEVDLLLPTRVGDPIILTHHSSLGTGDFLTSVEVDGYMVNGGLLGISEDLLDQQGAGVIVVNGAGVTFERGLPPLPTQPLPFP